MQKDLDNIKSALEEHLHAINDNSSEIQSLFDYVHEVEIKIDKLAQRLDRMQLGMGQQLEKPAVTPLSKVERKIFLALYTEEAPLTFQEIASRMQLPLPFIPECLSGLAHKGIPLQRSYVNNQLFFKLAPAFKELQAKENLVNLSLQSFME